MGINTCKWNFYATKRIIFAKLTIKVLFPKWFSSIILVLDSINYCYNSALWQIISKLNSFYCLSCIYAVRLGAGWSRLGLAPRYRLGAGLLPMTLIPVQANWAYSYAVAEVQEGKHHQTSLFQYLDYMMAKANISGTGKKIATVRGGKWIFAKQ